MPELVVLVLDTDDHIPGVLEAWLGAGVTGVTSIESSGLGHHLAEHASGADLPAGARPLRNSCVRGKIRAARSSRSSPMVLMWKD